MFKYLLLKSTYDLSDEVIVERSKYDMSFKHFLEMAPETMLLNKVLGKLLYHQAEHHKHMQTCHFESKPKNLIYHLKIQ